MRSGEIWLDYDDIVRALEIDSRRLPPRQESGDLDILASYGIGIVLELVWALIATGTR